MTDHDQLSTAAGSTWPAPVPLDDDAAQVLELSRHRPAVEALSPEEARAANLTQRSARIRTIEDVASVQTMSIEFGDHFLDLRVYWPGSQTDIRPALVYLHGGGWVVGDLETSDPLCRRLANRIDAVVVSVGYRLAPENPFPAAVDDARDAVRWVMANARHLGIEASQVAVGGDSSGGNLAAAACLALRDNGGPSPAAQLLIYPITHCSIDGSTFAAHLSSPILSAEAMEWYCRQYVGSEANVANPLVSPLLSPNLTGLPPAVIVTAALDVLRPQVVAYAQALRDGGVPVSHLDFPGVFHGFIGQTPAIARAAVAVDQLTVALRGYIQQ
jgi:acetyl esterase